MSWPQAITLSLSIVLFASGVVLNGLSARRDNERRLIQDAAAQMCSATSDVIARLKAIERKATADCTTGTDRDELERALPAVAAAHGRVRLAAGRANKGPGPPESASDWSQVLARVTLRIGAAVLADSGLPGVLKDPWEDKRVGQVLEKLKHPPRGDVGDVLGAIREEFIASARAQIAGAGLRRFI